MSTTLLIVNNPATWNLSLTHARIVSSKEYLSNPEFISLRHCRVLNLCHSYAYQGTGYYVSLLAEARGHKPVPSVATIQDMRYPTILRSISLDLDELIQESLKRLRSNRFTLSIYFSRNLESRYDKLSRQLFNLFPSPLLRAEFKKTAEQWIIQSLSPIPASRIPDSHKESVSEFAQAYFSKRTVKGRRRAPRFHLAILTNKEDRTAPSCSKAIEHFVAAADLHAIAAQVVSPDDYGRLAEFDGLFIRETTAVNNHTYRFSRRAEAEGMVVVDDPSSILRCTNKVFLAEMLDRYHIPAPKTIILHKENRSEVLLRLGLPCVLKQPDSSFSKGVVKVDSEREFHENVESLLSTSDLLIAQEFIRTEFDWRIGVFDRKPQFACKYYMARNHWQIYNNSVAEDEGTDYSGEYETIPIDLVPDEVIRTALKAADRIGDGLYGVDLKTIHRKSYVIEVNDNPSIEAGVEDAVLQNALYDNIMTIFLQRLETTRNLCPT